MYQAGVLVFMCIVASVSSVPCDNSMYKEVSVSVVLKLRSVVFTQPQERHTGESILQLPFGRS
jgi:hypothetical protein